MSKIIKSLKELIELASRKEGCECFITLNYGVRSSKFITYNKRTKKPFHVWNLIDNTNQSLTKKEIMDKSITNIGYALINNALIAEN
jgi:hypothetical protein